MNRKDKLLTEGEIILQKELEKITSKKAAIIISGGIDSSTLFVLALKHDYQLIPYSLINQQSQDLPYLKIIEKSLRVKINYLDMNSYPVELLKEKIVLYQQALTKLNIQTSLTNVTLAVGFDLLFQKIAIDGYGQVITGQGPDILLGGYHKYKEVPLNKLKTEIKNDLPLLRTDIKRDSFVAQKYNLELINPYLSQSFLDFALSLPIHFIRYRGENKYFLRLLSQKLKLPSEIVHRPKKAFQYSTRLTKTLRNLKN